MASAVTDGWMGGGAFFDSLIAATLLGYFADRWLGTDPWFVVSGIVLGSSVGFAKVWRYSRRLESYQRERLR